MVQRNAYILSGVLHLLIISLMLLLASKPPTQIRHLTRYQPVRLVSLPGKPGPTPIKEEVKREAPPPVKPKEKPKTETKPVKTKTEQKTVSTKSATTQTDTKPQTGVKSESAAETAAPGEGGEGGIRLDGARFPYPYYLNNIQIKILSNFKPVIRAKEAKGLKAVVYFIISRSGRISDVKLESKSGHFRFDQEAQRAVLRSNPLPALPPAFGSEKLGVHFEFVASD
jgi:colicin import membrane protein